MSGGAFGPEAHAFVAREKPTIYEKPLDLGLLSERLRQLAEDPDDELALRQYGL